MLITVSQLAEKIGGIVEGDASVMVGHMASLKEAQEGEISFLSNKRYADQMASTRATAVIVPADWQGDCPAAALIRVQNPDRAFSQAAAFLAPPPPVREPGIHPTAIISPDATIGQQVHLGPYVVIEAGAKIGDRSVIEAQCVIGEQVEIGPDAHLYPQVTIRERTRIGARFIAHSGVRIGADGFGYSIDMLPSGLPKIEKIPQVGIVSIGNDVEIGANTCIDRARFGETHIGNCVKIDNLVQIGHNVRINDFSGVIAQAGIAGSTTIGSGVRIWAQAGLSGHLHIGDGAQVGPQAGIAKDVAPGSYVIGTPQTTLRNMAAMTLAPEQLSKLRIKVRELEKALNRLQAGKEDQR